jgi:hypothetical protein
VDELRDTAKQLLGASAKNLQAADEQEARAEALRITAGELVAAASAGLSSHGLEAANGASGELDAETAAAAAQPAQMD